MERREQSLSHLLLAGLPGCIFRDRWWIGNADEAVARANLQTWAQNFDRYRVELRAPACLIEIFPLRLISDQVIAGHVIKSGGQPLVEIVVVVKENAAGSARQLVETCLRVAVGCLSLCFIHSHHPAWPGAIYTHIDCCRKATPSTLSTGLAMGGSCCTRRSIQRPVGTCGFCRTHWANPARLSRFSGLS